MIYRLNGKKFDIATEHKIGNVNYPRGWFLDADNRAAMGIEEIADPALPDSTTYTWTENDDGSLNVTLKALGDVKADQVAQLSAACQSAIYAGFTSNALGAAHTYPFGDLDQTNLTGSVLLSTLAAAGAPGWITPFLCADGSGVWAYRPHTQSQIQQAGTDAANAKLANLIKNATKAAQINAVATTSDPVADIAAVRAITWASA